MPSTGLRHAAAAAAALAAAWTATAPTTATAQHVEPFVAPGVPVGEPVAGNYTGRLRPQAHFSPPQHFMNDPNGLFVDADGTWHLYYQYNPLGLTAGNQHWGHATSVKGADGYVWLNQPIALYPPAERTYVFSGSVVVDVNNTSGFFPNQDNGVVAIMTLASYNEDGSNGRQVQGLAYSRDGGYSFEYYDGNPVLDGNSTQFRDPKVIRHGDGWVMVVSYAHEFVIAFYTSPDLRTWTHASNLSHHGLLGAQYECPNLARLPVRDAGTGAVLADRYVLTISLQPGAPLGGSATEYFIGDFNGTHFSPLDAATRLTDFGKDNYAAQFFYGPGPGQDALSIGWASNWQYAQQVPTGPLEGWRSVMTAPRAHYLTQAPRIGWAMISQLVHPAALLDPAPLRTATLDGANGSLVVDYSSVASNAIYLEANVSAIDTRQLTGLSTINLTLSSPVSAESLRAGFYLAGDTPFFVDRGRTRGFDNVFFTDKFSTAHVYHADPLEPAASWRFQALVDRSIFEVFLAGGLHAGTVLFYPEQPLTLLTLATGQLPAGTRVSVAVWSVKSGWVPSANEQGTVLGNVSAKATTGTKEREGPAKRHMIYEGSFVA